MSGLLDPRDAEKILSTALKNGGDFADIFIEKKKGTGITCEADKIERVFSGLDVGAGIRVIYDGRTAYAFTNDVTFEGLMKVAEEISKVIQGNNGSIILNMQQKEPPYSFEIKEAPDKVSVDEKVGIVDRANKAARSYDNRIKQVIVGYGDAVQEITVANSEGTYINGERIRTRLIVNVVASDGKHIQTGFESAGGFSGFELFKTVSPVELARKAAARAVLMLEAKPAPAGQMTVVMAGEAGGTMIHEACGHGLEADLVQKKLSVYAGKMGEKVAAETVTVIDDATIPNLYGSFPFDDEGMEGQKTVLIENGVLKSYMYDWLTASREKRKSTGNGRRESYQYKPIPRMTNTYIAPGKYDPQEIIEQTDKGLYVKKMGGGQVNTTTGDFVFEVSEGYLIEKGKVTVPVRGATLTGNGPQVLQTIDMVGNDLGWAIGTCGKDGQGVPVGDAQPTIRIPKLVVGGILE